MQELAANDDLFQNPISHKPDLEGIFGDIMPEVTVEGSVHLTEEDVANGAERKTMVRSGRNRTIYVYEGDGTVWLDVSRLEEGERGSAVYAAVSNYAHNAGRIFIGDPAGLSDIALSVAPRPCWHQR